MSGSCTYRSIKFPQFGVIFVTFPPGDLQITRHFWRLTEIPRDLPGLLTHSKNVTTSIHCRKKHFPQVWGGMAPRGPLATPLVDNGVGACAYDRLPGRGVAINPSLLCSFFSYFSNSLFRSTRTMSTIHLGVTFRIVCHHCLCLSPHATSSFHWVSALVVPSSIITCCTQYVNELTCSSR